MERYALSPALRVQELKCEITIPIRELDGFERHRDKFVPHAVIVADLETPPGELRIPFNLLKSSRIGFMAVFPQGLPHHR